MCLKKVNSFLFFFIGISTGLFIFRKVIIIYDLMYRIAVAYLALRSFYLCLIKNRKLTTWPFYLRDLGLVICLIFGLVFSLEFFIDNLFGMVSMLLIGIITIKKPDAYESESYLKGLKITFIINYIFALIQIFFLIKYKINIFYQFGYLIGFYDSFDAKIAENATRVTGLIWDPYVIGMYCAIGFFLFHNKLLKLAILVILFYSSSRAGELALFVAILYYYAPNIKKCVKKDHLSLPLFMLLVSVFFISIPFLIDTLNLDRGFNKESQGWRRVEYITKIPEIWENDGNLFLSLFGGAPMYTGGRYVFTEVHSMAKSQSFDNPKWGVESDWFGILIGRGLFGFFMYLILYIKIIYSKRSRLNKTLAVAVFIGGVGYVYDTAIFSLLLVYFAGNTVYIVSEKGNIKRKQ